MSERLTASEREALVARVRGALCSCPIPCTKECLAVVWVNDARALVTEVERLTRERDALIADLDDASREITDLTDENALMRENVTRLTAELERLKDGGIMVPVSAELLTDGRWTDEPLYVRLEGNPSDGYRLTFRRVDAARTTGGRDA